MSKQIFIGGTGRSGTSILYRLLDSHPSIHAFDLEMRFLIDPRGLIDLVDALTRKYSVPQSREALYQFDILMRKELANKYSPPYIGFDFHSTFDKEYYHEKIDEFMLKLSESSFYGADYPVRGGIIQQHFGFIVRVLEKFYRLYHQKVLRSHKDVVLWPYRKMYNVNFFESREELCLLAGKFVNDLFMHAAKKNGATMWCEKTPSNLLHIDFLYELFPDAKFIHIKRDPRGVIQSMQQQFWFPSNLEDSCKLMKQMYRKWFSVKNSIDLSEENYLEIKLEDLAADYVNGSKKIRDFIGLDSNFINPPKLSIDKVDYWKHSLPADSVSTINTILADEIEEMGYSVNYG